MTAELTVEERDAEIVVAGAGYRLAISRHAPLVTLRVGGRALATLNVAAGLDTVAAFDEDTALDPPQIVRDGSALLATWPGHSTLWPSKRYELRAEPGGFSYGYDVQGAGVIDRAHLFRTRQQASPANNLLIFNPEPNSGAVQYSGQHCPPNAGKVCMICPPDATFGGPDDFTLISTGRDKLYHDGNWFFTPAPFCLAFAGEGNWLAAGIAAAPGEWSFSDLQYPGGGFGLSLLYKGHLSVQGAWRSPRLICMTAPDEYAAVGAYCAALREMGLAPDHGRGPVQDWWRQPIFCGWGEQVSQEVHAGGAPKAPEQATQENYLAWLNSLQQHDVDPGTIVIDDKWQGSYGLNDADSAKWPDLRGFIAGQHGQGRRVLLWLKAWDPEGVPDAECIRGEDGTPLAVDPGGPAFQQRFAAQVRRMLVELDADGFKVDFTHLIPRGISADHAMTMALRDGAAGYVDPWPEITPAAHDSAGGKWGLELMRQWLELLSDAARAAKPDAVIITHTANPYLADLVDVLRLNDVAGLPDRTASIRPAMQHRARIARAASPFWLLDADNWPCSSREQWRDYVAGQASGAFGIPALYHAERFGWGGVDEALLEEDYRTVRGAWRNYRAGLKGG